ncbi:MAG: PDZ domain-containing protein [Calditrichaeota bacterium]|nr:PDZ domain-containing protein [Calditrichota bacterium]
MKRIIGTVILVLLLIGAFFAQAADRKEVKKVVVIARQNNDYTFGIVALSPDKEVLEKYNLDGGAEIIKVFAGSEAERIGLKEHDIIVRFDGKKVSDPEDLEDYMEDIDEEKDVDVVVNRKGKELNFTAHLQPTDENCKHEFTFKPGGKRFRFFLDSIPQFDFGEFPFMTDIMSGKGGYLGVVVDELNEQMRDYFEVEYGVLVKRVIKDSPAEKAGIKAGDVIYKINDKKIEDPADLIRTVRYYDPGDKIKVYLNRKGKNKTITVELGKRKKHSGFYRNFPWFPPKGKGKDWEVKSFKGRLWHPGENERIKEREERGIYLF